MSKKWNPNSYTLENQLADIINGKEVVTSDDGTVMKGNNHHVDLFWQVALIGNMVMQDLILTMMAI